MRLDYQELFEKLPGLYLVIAPDLTIIAVTDAYARAAMLPAEAMIGRALFEVFPDNPDDPDADGVKNLRASLERVRERKQRDEMPVQPLRRAQAVRTIRGALLDAGQHASAR